MATQIGKGFCFKCGADIFLKNNVPRLCNTCFLNRREKRIEYVTLWVKKNRKLKAKRVQENKQK